MIHLLGMYTSQIYEAIEAYALDRTNRSKYDAVLEAVTKRANELLTGKA